MASTLTHSLLHAPQSQRRGLLGLGGIGGSQPPAGLLGRYYDPAEERRRKISGAMTQAGIQLLTNGKGSFGEVLGQGLAGAVQGAENAGINYRTDAMGYNKLAQDMENQQYTRNREMKQDAWTNTEHQYTLDERARADEEKQAKKAAIMDWAHKKETAQPGFLAWAGQFPEEAAKLYSSEMMPGESKVLSPGQTIVGPNYQPLYTAPQEPPKPTSGIQDYEYYARFERAAGRQPKSPFEYEQSIRKSGATSINNINGANGDFDKELSKGVAGVYTSAMEAGQNAVATKTAAQQLRVLMTGRGGSLDGLSAAAAPYLPPGLVPEGATDIVAAQAIIAGLVPKQRVPGSGTTSDFDARKFSESLPNLWNKPGANEIITNTMESYADYQIAVSNVIADVASNPQIANKAAAIREQISQIPDPFEGWKQYMAASGSGSGGGKVIDGYTIRRVQ